MFFSNKFFFSLEESAEDDFQDDDKRKKKRATKKKRSNLENFREQHILPSQYNDIKKRSVNWSKIWGMDRKKKSVGP